MRSGARLKGASPEQISSHALYGNGSLDDLVFAFHGARTGDHDRSLPRSDFDISDFYHGALGMEIPGYHFIRLRNVDNFLDPGKIPDSKIVDIPLIAQNTDGGSLASGYGFCL